MAVGEAGLVSHCLRRICEGEKSIPPPLQTRLGVRPSAAQLQRIRSSTPSHSHTPKVTLNGHHCICQCDDTTMGASSLQPKHTPTGRYKHSHRDTRTHSHTQRAYTLTHTQPRRTHTHTHREHTHTHISTEGRQIQSHTPSEDKDTNTHKHIPM